MSARFDVELEVVSERCRRIFRDRVEVEVLADGLVFSEGPAWDAVEERIVFSDIVADARYAWSDRSGLHRILDGTGKANGLAFDATGNLIACEHLTSCVVRIRDGERSVIASQWGGRELNSPNDVAVAADGAIWFTDPSFGRTSDRLGALRDVQLDVRGVYRLDPRGELELVDDRSDQPNGVCFSPDGESVYVSDTARGELVRLRRGAAGWSRYVLADGIDPERDGESRVDGMVCDAEGHVLLTGPGGLWIFDPDGEFLGRVRVPGQLTNVTWAGGDARQLVITAREFLFRITPDIGGPGRSAAPGLQ